MAILVANSIAEISTQLQAANPGDEVHVVPATSSTGVPRPDDPTQFMYDQGPTLDGIHKADYVSIRGSDPNVQTSWRGRTSLKDASYIRIEGIRMLHHATDQSDALVTHNGSHHIQIYNCDIRDGDSGAEFFSTSFLEVVGCRFGGHMGDCMKFGAVTDFVVIDNIDDGTRQNVDPTSHLDFIQGQASCSRGTFRGNVFLGHNAGGKVVQGIFLSDAPYDNILIENNIIYTNAANGIRIGNPENTPSNIDVLRNTVLSSSGSNTNITINGGSGTVDFNVTNSGAGPNGHTIAPGDYSSVYQSVSGPQATIQDFTPVPGGPGDFGTGVGAEQRIAELLNEPPIDPPEDPPMADTITVTSIDVIRSTPNAPAATAVIEADNTITIDPNDPDYTGLIEVDYTITDGETPPNTASATIFATFSGSPPVANDDTVVGPKGSPINIDPKLNDTAD